MRKLIIRKKRTYIVNTLGENRTIPKKFWKEIQKNLYFGRHKNNISTLAVLNSNNSLVTGLEAANLMNEYYVQVGPSLAAKFIGAWDPNSLGPIDSTLNMMFRFIGTKETASLVKSLKDRLL